MRRFALVAFLVCSFPAHATLFSVNPVHIHLSPKTTSALLTVHNDSPDPLRLQVSLFAWEQTREGETKLLPTTDIVFFPALLTIDPKQERKIRLGPSVPVGEIEKTYRILVEELPPPETPKKDKKKEVTVRILTRMSIPLFFQPASPRTEASIDNLAATAGNLRFDLASKGNAHLLAQRVVVQAAGAEKKALWERDLPAWYVLAAGSRAYELKLPKESCADVRSLTVRADLDIGKIDRTLETPKGACLP